MSNQLLASSKRELIDIYKHSLNAIKPDRLVRNALKLDQDNIIINDSIKVGFPRSVHSLKQRRLHVIGGGKCSLAMAKGLAELAGRSRVTHLFSHGCLSVPSNSLTSFESDTTLQSLLESIQIECKFGAKNNLPDEASVLATELILNRVVEASEADRRLGCKSLFIVLISGGGSACLSSPKHISLNEKTRLISGLVQKGANIVEVNKVRRCFSGVKGGNLARYIRECSPEAEVVSLIISDVIGDPVEFIASGPTFIEETNESLEAAMDKILLKYGLDSLKVPGNLRGSPVRTMNNRFVINNVIGNNEIAICAARDKALDLKYNVVSLGNNLSGYTTEILDKLLQTCKYQKRSKLLVMGGGEATVERLSGETWGVGGRAQEMAMDYIIAQLSDKLPRGEKEVDIFLAGSTDGQDGPTDVSGCLASYAEWLSNKCFNLEDVVSAKKNHDAFNFWNKRKPDWLLRFGPTGTNVMDLYFLSLVKSAQ